MDGSMRVDSLSLIGVYHDVVFLLPASSRVSYLCSHVRTNFSV